MYILGDNKEEGENEVGEQPRRYRQPRQQNWYNSYRGNRRGPPPNRGEGGDYNNVRIVFKIILRIHFRNESNLDFMNFEISKQLFVCYIKVKLGVLK